VTEVGAQTTRITTTLIIMIIIMKSMRRVLMQVPATTIAG
jgi:hypothetical protein